MWASSNPGWRAGLEIRTLRLPLHQSFATVPTRRATVDVLTSHVELPQRLWDRIIPFLFICCLFVFLHALLGFGIADNDLNALNQAITSRTGASQWNRDFVGSSGYQRLLAQGIARVVVDWQGNYPGTTAGPISPVMIPRDMSPNPTPALFGAEPGEAKMSADLLAMFRGDFYDTFQQGLKGSVEGGGRHRPVVLGQPRMVSQRKRRFGRCLPEDVCL